MSTIQDSESHQSVIEQGIISMIDEEPRIIPVEPQPEEMIIQYMSDLHLEFYDEDTIIEVLKYIVPMHQFVCLLVILDIHLIIHMSYL